MAPAVQHHPSPWNLGLIQPPGPSSPREGVRHSGITGVTWGHSPSQPEGFGGVEAKEKLEEPLGVEESTKGVTGVQWECGISWHKGWEEWPCHKEGRAQRQ